MPKTAPLKSSPLPDRFPCCATTPRGPSTSGIPWPGVAILRTRAVLADAHTIRLAGGETVRAAHVLIATGGAPSLGGPIPGREHVISSNEAFHLPALPPRVLIQGGGYIALEFAGIFAGLGSAVTLIYRGTNILRGFDDDVRTHLRAEMERHGIAIMTGDTVAAVEQTGSAYTVLLAGGKRIEVDRVMFATGRKPNVNGLGLEAVGVTVAESGHIAVDEFSRTSVPNIYAVGDVTNRINLTPVAIRENRRCHRRPRPLRRQSRSQGCSAGAKILTC